MENNLLSWQREKQGVKKMQSKRKEKSNYSFNAKK